MIPAAPVTVYTPKHWAEIPDRALSLAGAVRNTDVENWESNDVEVAAVYVAGIHLPQASRAAGDAGIVAGSVDAWRAVPPEEVRELVAAGLLRTPGEVVVYSRVDADPVVAYHHGHWDVVGRFQRRRVGTEWETRVVSFGAPDPVRVVVELDADTPPEVLETLRTHRLSLSPIFGREPEVSRSAGGFIVADA